ncbi:MAG: inorganic phosphate transporter [Gemmatimonadetes bacterium]|nr:inorganic phosphate transporter [Gemmatimonadota bacterium]MBK7349970.1 inorganic phosphate transporter [Gemmatimonadota bacterium]MBK7715582.1 inorganic phosphate transporter [Gemmatimonadota bacterium]MBK7784596.1 inorganic phosphate transporter [Gemmatimonadota bacterium]MBK7925553.1 inorganic phosphate transporter [Gemmatimonadota bacterium]
MDATVAYILVVIVVALAFDFINGFHDSANSIATVVATRVLSPGAAVIWAAFFNFIAAFVMGTAVAKTIGKGLVDPAVLDTDVILAALTGAIIWNLITWWLGLPSSSSHALMGGLGGAAIAKAGVVALIPGGWVKPVSFIFLSPLIGTSLALLLTVALSWLLRRGSPGPIDRVFRRLQLVSAGLYSIGHGGNDAQKTMGIIVGLLVAGQASFEHQTGWMSHLYLKTADHIPMWIVLSAHAAIAAGTAMGGWRIVKTMGAKITRLRPFGGFCAETAGGMTLLIASHFGIPVSTTHTITGAIVGVGATQRISAVRWGVAGRIVWAWIFTIPMAAAMAGLTYLIVR